MSQPKAIAFIDASNLFYGGEKSLGWKIDYQKLIKYLMRKYGVGIAYYFGGIDIYRYPYDYLSNDTVPLAELEAYLGDKLHEGRNRLATDALSQLEGYLKRVRFYLRLEEFGYKLFIKPVKRYRKPGGGVEFKANCDVDMAFHLMKEKRSYDRAVVLSGDGDFLPVLKHLKSVGKEVILLARGPRAAREIKQFAGSQFKDFVRLEKELRYTNQKDGHARYPSNV